MNSLLRLTQFALISTILLSGCSSFKKSFDSEDSTLSRDNYRVTQDTLLSPLELPPNFQNPDRNMNASNRQLMGQLNQALSRKDIPSYHVDGLSVQSNLSERWLHIAKVDSDDLWERLQRFLNAQGFTVEEARKDVGVIRTNFLARKEIVPKSEMSFLTRILNSWREETAEGAMDRLTLRVETDAQGGANVYLRHSMIIADNSDGDITTWRSRPYHPEFEAEMLYQAMTFLGASMTDAIAQIKATEVHSALSLDGAFAGISLAAGLEESWQYILSLSDRAGFSVLNTDKANGIMTLRLSDVNQPKPGFFARLFGTDKTVRDVVLRFKEKGAKQTDVLADGVDNQTLSAEEKRAVFQRIGAIEQ